MEKLKIKNISIQQENPMIFHIVDKFLVKDKFEIISNALDYIQVYNIQLPIVFNYETKTYKFVKDFHFNLFSTLNAWLNGKIELESRFLDIEDIKKTSYRGRIGEKYIRVDIIVDYDENAKEVEYLIELYKSL